MDEVKQYWSRNAAAFDNLYSEEPSLSRWINRHLRKGLYERYALTFIHAGDVKGKRILDIGCGSGPYSVEFARLGAQVVGLDFAKPMLELARRRAQEAGVADRCSFLETDFLKYEAEKPFDVTIAIGVFDYVTDRVGFLARMRQVTRGKVIASFPGISMIRMPIRKIRYTLRGCPVFFYWKKELEKICDDAGVPDRDLVRMKSSGGGWLLVGRTGAV